MVYWQYDESKSQELIERKIKKAPPEMGTVRMLSREEWDIIQELPPKTPFESPNARPNSRIRTGEPLHVVKLNSLIIYHYFSFQLIDVVKSFILEFC